MSKGKPNKEQKHEAPSTPRTKKKKYSASTRGSEDERSTSPVLGSNTHPTTLTKPVKSRTYLSSKKELLPIEKEAHVTSQEKGGKALPKLPQIQNNPQQYFPIEEEHAEIQKIKDIGASMRSFVFDEANHVSRIAARFILERTAEYERCLLELLLQRARLSGRIDELEQRLNKAPLASYASGAGVVWCGSRDQGVQSKEYTNETASTNQKPKPT